MNEMLHKQGNANTTPSHVARYAGAYDSTQETTPIGIGHRPAWSWGPDPSLYVPAFACAMNDLDQLKDVVIETPVSDCPELCELWLRDMSDKQEWVRCLAEPFDMVTWISMLADATAGFRKERKFNEHIHTLLEKFFDDSTLALHDRGHDTEMDMKGECMTAHGHTGIWFVFEGKLWNGVGGAPELQAVCSVQRRIMDLWVIIRIASFTCNHLLTSI